MSLRSFRLRRARAFYEPEENEERNLETPHFSILGCGRLDFLS